MVECFQSDLDDPPSIGSIITVKHSGTFPNGKLKSPMFWREREDMKWEDISMSPSLTHNMVCQHIDLLYLQYFRHFQMHYGTREKIGYSSSNS